MDPHRKTRFVPAATRMGHITLLHLAQTSRPKIGLSPDGARLQHVFVSGRPPEDVREPPWPTGGQVVRGFHKAPRNDGKVPVGGFYCLAYEMAHVLRVGREGPLIPPGEWAPVDGDWLHAHPDNWRRADDPAARLPGSTSVPQDDSELF